MGFLSVPCWSRFGGDRGGGQDDGFLVFGLHLRVESSQVGVLRGQEDDFSENVVAAHGEVVGGGLG